MNAVTNVEVVSSALTTCVMGILIIAALVILGFLASLGRK